MKYKNLIIVLAITIPIFIISGVLSYGENLTYTIAQIQALLDAVNGRVTTSAGVADAGKMIVLDATGAIDTTLYFGATDINPVDTGDENATFYPILVDGATGTQGTETDAEFSYNPSTDMLTIAGITGVTSLNTVTATEIAELTTIGDTTITAGQWVFVGAQDQATYTTSDVQFNQVTLPCHTSQEAAGTITLGQEYCADGATWDPSSSGLTEDHIVMPIVDLTGDEYTWILIRTNLGVQYVSGIMIGVAQVASTRVLTAAEAAGGWIVVTEEIDVEIPDCEAATIGMNVCIEQGDASETISVAALSTSNDVFLMNGVTFGGEAEHEIDSPGTAGSRGADICLICTEDDLWRVKGREGTWIDGGVLDDP